MRWRSKLPLWLLLSALVLVVVRIALPYVVRDTLNHKMAHMGDYSGHVADVDLSLWRGAYTLNHLTIHKVSGKVPVPLLDTRRLDISLGWHALLHGAIVGKATFMHPILNFVDGAGTGDSQAGIGVNWKRRLESLMPLQLDEVRVKSGTVTFHNFISNPQVNLKLNAVNGTLRNLSNARGNAGKLRASLSVHARLFGEAPLHADAKFDAFAPVRNFDFNFKVNHIELKKANDFARAYAHVDLDSGRGQFVMQMKSRDGRINGYAKPLLKHLEVFSWKQDVEKEKENPLQLAWEAVVGGLTNLFKNHGKDQFAMRIPITGTIKDEDNDALGTIVSILHNTFIAALKPQFEQLPSPPKGEGGHG